MKLKNNKSNSNYTMTAKRTQMLNRIKRKFSKIDFECAVFAAFAVAIIIGMAFGFITAIKTPMGYLDTAFSRFLDFVHFTLVGGISGFGAMFILIVLGACLVAITDFISKFRG